MNFVTVGVIKDLLSELDLDLSIEERPEFYNTALVLLSAPSSEGGIMGRGLRSLALALAFLCSIGWLAIAQSGRGGGYRQPRANRIAAHLRWLGAQLNLTENQEARLKPILMEESQKIRSIRHDASIPKEQEMEKVQSIHDSFQPQINDVLTPEQRERYKQLEEKARERWQPQKSSGSTTTPGQQANHNSDE